MSTSLRIATEADLSALVEMGRSMHAESPRFRHLDFSAEKAARFALALISSPEGRAVIAEKDGHIVGMFLGFVTEHYFGGDRMASDLALYVVPEERGGTAGVRLIKDFEGWARETGAVECVIGVNTGLTVERTKGLLEKMGYAMSGVTMRKGFDHV